MKHSTKTLRSTYSTIAKRLPTNFHGDGASQSAITSASKQLGVQLPLSFRTFLSTLGWFESGELTVYGLGSRTPRHLQLVRMTKIEKDGWQSIESMRSGLIPISPDGRGGHYCLDTERSESDECPVVYWDHELIEPGYKPEFAAKTFKNFFDRHAPRRPKQLPKGIDSVKGIKALAKQATRWGFVGDKRWAQGATLSAIKASEKEFGFTLPNEVRELFLQVDGFKHPGGYRHYGVRKNTPDELSSLALARQLRKKSTSNARCVPVSHIWVGPYCCVDCETSPLTVVLFDNKTLVRSQHKEPLPFPVWAWRMGKGSLDPWNADM